MPGLSHLTIATGLVLIFVSPLHAQAPSNSTLRPATDGSVTTGIGTGSSIKTVPPPADQPPPQTSRPVFWDTPEAHMKPAEEEASQGADRDAGSPAAGTPPAPVVENPRKMITRDRIESPQH